MSDQRFVIRHRPSIATRLTGLLSAGTPLTLALIDYVTTPLPLSPDEEDAVYSALFTVMAESATFPVQHKPFSAAAPGFEWASGTHVRRIPDYIVVIIDILERVRERGGGHRVSIARVLAHFYKREETTFLRYMNERYGHVRDTKKRARIAIVVVQEEDQQEEEEEAALSPRPAKIARVEVADPRPAPKLDFFRLG